MREFVGLSISCIALLGRKDEPTDALEDYCHYLASALKAHDIQLEIGRVSWEVNGWSKAFEDLRFQSISWCGTWVLIQYTALSWSARGFPQRVLSALKILRAAGARVGIVFHDVEPYPGTRIIDSVRRFNQILTMRRALALADLSIFTVPPGNLSWLKTVPSTAVFVPVGPNLPIPTKFKELSPHSQIPTIGVFSITGGESGTRETEIIITACRFVAQKLGKLRLSVFGRHSEVHEVELRNKLSDLPVQLSVDGILTTTQIIEKLSTCDVLLFVRGAISSRRSSAIAGIACGLPIIAYPGSETGVPITDAGVILVPPEKAELLNDALVRVLTDYTYRENLAARSRAAYKEHFSWTVIAARFSTLLKDS